MCSFGGRFPLTALSQVGEHGLIDRGAEQIDPEAVHGIHGILGDTINPAADGGILRRTAHQPVKLSTLLVVLFPINGFLRFELGAATLQTFGLSSLVMYKCGRIIVRRYFTFRDGIASSNEEWT
jgi:hypothetical protein